MQLKLGDVKPTFAARCNYLPYRSGDAAPLPGNSCQNPIQKYLESNSEDIPQITLSVTLRSAAVNQMEKSPSLEVFKTQPGWSCFGNHPVSKGLLAQKTSRGPFQKPRARDSLRGEARVARKQLPEKKTEWKAK